MGNRVVVAGAGGHARVCLDALLDDVGLDVIGCVSADGAGVDGLPVPVLGRTDDLAAIAAEYGCTRVFVAIGDNAARRRVAAEAHAARLSLVDAVSRHSMISRSAYVGAGAMVAAGAVVNAGAQVGMGVIVNTSASVDHDCRIDDYAHIAPGAVLGGEVVVGANALVAIGARVLPRVTIGENAVVGAGSVVVRDVAPGAVVVGVPAAAHFGLTSVRPAG